MRRTSLIASSLLLGLALSLQACGGGSHQDAKSGDSAAKADLSSMDELKAIPTDLNADITDLMKPIDDSQTIADEITAMPARLHLDAKQLMTMAKATLSDGKVDVSFDASAQVAEDAKAEVKAELVKLKGVVDGLKATPDKVAALTQKIASVSAKVPALATKVSTEASVKMSNPFGSADDKAKAKADADSVKQVQDDISKQVSDAQSKITGIPAMATSALGKLTAAFAGSAGGSGDAKANAKTTAKPKKK